jgi:hypothetical protein
MGRGRGGEKYQWDDDGGSSYSESAEESPCKHEW